MRIATPEGEQNAALRDTSAIREGKHNHCGLVAGNPKSLSHYNTLLTRMDTAWEAPRHRHCFEQIRLLLEGEIRYGKDKILRAGEIAYFPEGVHYGPQVRAPGSVLLQIQFGGASKTGYLGVDEIYAASQELAQKGKFEKGIYTYYDDQGVKHNQDSYEACWERRMGRAIEYPKPRYHDIVLINPASFEWAPLEDMPGVDIKRLGSFTERGTQVDLIRLASGATLNAGLHCSGELLFLTKGSVETPTSNTPLDIYSSFGLEPNEGPVAINAIVPTELFRLRLPALD